MTSSKPAGGEPHRGFDSKPEALIISPSGLIDAYTAFPFVRGCTFPINSSTAASDTGFVVTLVKVREIRGITSSANCNAALSFSAVLTTGNSDEVGHAFQNEAGHLFRTEAGRCSDLKPAT
jgi:hypothetical protein